MKLFLVTLVILIGCSNAEKKKKIVYKSEGFYEEGICIRDSVFDGRVERYDLNDSYLGYANYSNGILNGLYINKYLTGITEDSILFKNGMKDGMSFKFDDKGRLITAINYLNDRAVGDIYSYDSSGKITEYLFQNFEGKNLYDVKFINNDTIEFGGLSNYRYDTVTINDKKEMIHLFLYLVYIPDLQMHYEIAKVNHEKIISSEKISSNNCFYETDLDFLPKEYNYAIVASVFNKSKGRDDLTVYVLE
jgi:hypothetical protein